MTISPDTTFRALKVTETPDKDFERRIIEQTIADLPEGDLVVQVRYSSINYKDMLSCYGNRGVTRSYPHTPGIDAAGVVVADAGAFKAGDEVIVTSYDLGMNTHGGFSEYIRVPSEWAVPLPEGLTLRESMIFGTAGFTAGLSVYRLVNNGVSPDKGTVLVTGASGGVGGVALSILSKIGYTVTAVNGVVDATEYLKHLGASEVISIEDALGDVKRPMLKPRWAGVIDAVGGDMLASAIKSTMYGGTVTCCGNAGGMDLPLNVYPFILRGVTLIGIDSQNCPMDHRRATWKALAGDWKIESLGEITTEIRMEELVERVRLMHDGKHRGRTVVKVG